LKPKIKAPSKEIIDKTLNIIEKYDTKTICFSSKCPNISECFGRGTASFLILGDICSRNCSFCNVKFGKPKIIDKNEGLNIAKSIQSLNLNYVVLTSVDRDDLTDFGSGHFCDVVKIIKRYNPNIKIELLTPDFKGYIQFLNRIVELDVYKLSHNIETIEKLHKKLKPKSDYKLSLKILEYYSKFKITKSSIIVGFGETFQELKTTFSHLRDVGVSQLTIGQYLQPSKKHYKVQKYYNNKEFEELKQMGLELGFKEVVSGELVRSSYYADKL
jgi:lipoic acid synthetase